MSFWLRELVGWGLLAISLLMVLVAYVLCINSRMFEVWPWVILTIFVFRGAIHLLKVAIAARICNQAQHRLYPADDPAAPRQLAPPTLSRKYEGSTRLGG
jgi:hypothetical protein